MRIYGSTFDPLRPDRSVQNRTPGAISESQQQPSQPSSQPNTTGPARSDSVQISAEGRSLASRAESEAGSLDPDRVAELRNKVLTGAYNSLDVVDQVARRILTRGDL